MTMQGRNWALAFLVGGAFLSAGPVPGPGTGAWRIGPGAFQEAKKAGKSPALAERYRKWLDEEVLYIISENEKDVFRSLRTDAERDSFIKMFWKRRDPTPETPVNEFRGALPEDRLSQRHLFRGEGGMALGPGKSLHHVRAPGFL